MAIFYLTFFTALLSLALSSSALSQSADNTIYYGIHSHNDYKEQDPPLWHAVSLGIGSVEADIWLVNNTLYIGHMSPTNVTLEELYFQPLMDKIQKDGYIWNWESQQPLNLFIDLKSEGENTYAVLEKLINDKFADIFSWVDPSEGVVHQGHVHCIITGNRPIDTIANTKGLRFCSIDAPDMSYVSCSQENLFPITSMKWQDVFGEFKYFLFKKDLEKLDGMIQESRANNARLRFWSAPNFFVLWKQLMDADGEKDTIVINADYLSWAVDSLKGKGYNNTNQGCSNEPGWCAENND